MISTERLDPAYFRQWFVIVAILFSGLFAPLSVSAAKTVDTANVMAPLRVNNSDWGAFESQLATVKGYGVTAVSVDVWWGEVEGASDNNFNWSYYDTIFSKIKAKGLKIVPILSFHQCGGNVGDDCNIPLPPWLWGKYVGNTFNGIKIDSTDLKYKSEQGHFSNETLQLWADGLVANEYADFVNAFKSHFSAYDDDFIEINVSAGPSGELRYPSYNGHDSNTGYPTRGGLQSYSRLAVLDFQTKTLNKYGTLAGVNAAWKTNLTDVSQIQPPANAESFFSKGDYKNIPYGKDFVDWYNQSLVDHGKTLLSNVIGNLGNAFPSAKIGYKIPGVHWKMADPTYPRAAEVAAGLIQTSVDFNADVTGHGYANIVGLAKTLSSQGRQIVLHFTCLEMDDQNFDPQYSLAKNLVFWVANEAQRQGVIIKGENALSGGITSDHGWDNINNAFDFGSYTGLTTLRIGEVASGTGQTRYAAFIKKYIPDQPVGFPTLYLRGTNNNWGKTPMSKTGTVWSSSNVSFGNTATERFKFDVKGDWSQNYGGSGPSGAAVQSGGDITVAAKGTYDISFDESNKSYTVTSVTGPKPTDKWYFRGTPNNWGVTEMSQVGTSDVFTVTVEFSKQPVNPRFKIDHFADWKENYPAQDVLVKPDCASYEISFNRVSKQIETKKIQDITTGACGGIIPPPKAPLGVTYKPEATTFALWSPDSANVQLSLDNTLYPMVRVPDTDGLTDVYAVTVAGDQNLKRYNFRVEGRVARDPYGVMVEPGTNNNLVVDLTQTEPKQGWIPRPPLKQREDAVIYEVHLRDFTIDPSSGVPLEKRGKFLGMVEAGTKFPIAGGGSVATGIDHLKELGVTHVQILPFYDFRACTNAPGSCYTWGYDPVNYNIPEERYSVSSDPLDRIRELKATINELHKAGIRVVMDVVYNHTPDKTVFGPITDKYYLNNDISGAGATINVHQQPMVSRFIRDSLEYWVREYHIDGFRFDLMGIFDYAAVGDWGRYLNQKYPEASLLVYGEPWKCCGDDPVNEAERIRLGSIGKIVDAHAGAFNDQYRKALKGDGDSGGGGGYLFNQAGDLFPIRVGSRGAIRYEYSPNKVLPNPWDQMFANDPEQTINYVSAHDNLILRDKILAWAKQNGASNNASYLKRIQEFAGGILLTSQGIPFIQAGDEMLRDKQGNPNSYDLPDSVNAIRWNWKADNADVVNYYKQAIALRKSHPGFRLTSWDQINTNVNTQDTLRNGVVVNTINAQANGDGWQKIIVIYNSANDYEYTLPAGTWFVAMEKSDANPWKDRAVTGKVTAEGTAVTVLHQ